MDIVERLNDKDVVLTMAKTLKEDADNKVLKHYKSNSKFSKGEDITESDLDLISNRSKNSPQEGITWTESYYSDMGNAALQWNPEATINSYELQYDPESTFQIGDNLKGGI